MSNFPWFALGFALGALCQDDGVAQISHDFGQWLRCAVIACE